MNIKSFIIGTAMAGLAACQSSSSTPEPSTPAPTEGLVAGAEEQLVAFSAKAVAAFRGDGGGFRAGHATHDVSVTNGSVELTPYHVDESAQRIRGGTLGLRTSAIRSGDSSIDGAVSTRLVDGVVEITRGAAVETITNRAEGVEQAWRFAARPGTDGDLTVTVAMLGQNFITDTEQGLHFQSDKGLGFRYSDAVWVEADGTRWPINARFENGAIVMTVPEDVVANSTYPAVLDPTITAEVAVDAPVNGGVGTASTQPTIAFDGTNYLVVWEDRRLDVDPDIFAARVSSAGALIDNDGIAIATGVGAQSRPVVAFAGGAFVVAWQDFKVVDGTEADIVAARVSTTGAVTQLGTVGGTASSETEPAIAGSGATAFLSWTVSANIVGSLFNGTNFGGIVTVAGTTADEIQSAVAGNGTGQFLVAWSEGVTNQANLRGSIVTGGTPGAAFDISTQTARQFNPAASFSGGNYIVVWSEAIGTLNISGGRVSQAGAPLDGAIGVVVTAAADSQEEADISCTASQCLVIWRERRNFAATSFDVFAQRITSAIQPSGGEIIVANANQPQQAPAVGSNGTAFFGVWHDERDARIKVVTGSTVSAAGAVGAPTILVRGNNREFNPAVGHSGNVHYVAWTDSRSNDSTGLEFVRFNGLSKLDVTSRTLNNAANAQVAPSISANGGTSSFVVWSDTRNGIDNDIFTTRVSSDGSVSNAGTPVAVAAGDQLVPIVSSAGPGGTSALVVWQDRRGANFDIMGALLDATGNVVVSDIVICNAAGDQTRPSAAYDPVADQWIVVWSDGRVQGDNDIFAARVALAGGVLDANGINISNAASSQFTPVVAFTGNVFLAVWQDRRNDTQGDIFGARMQAGAQLTVLDPAGIPIGGTAGSQSSPSLAQNVGSFLVAWQDTRNAATTGSDIFAIGIGASGVVGEPEFTVSATADDETTPAVGDSSSGKVSRIAYVKERPDLQTVRVVSRQITVSGTTGTTCSQDSQCGVGGFCRDSRCCDSDCGGVGTVDCQACKGTLTGQPDGVCAVVLANKTCRNYADTFCDRVEKCDGIALTCPDDIGRREGVACTTDGGTAGVCPANDVTGAPHVCQ